MGNSDEGNKYNKLIDFTLTLDKICYFPGETISGTIHLVGKPGLLQAQLADPKCKFVVYEVISEVSQERAAYANNPYVLINDSSNFLDYNNFIGSNLLTGVNLPFTYPIPFSFNPTTSALLDNKYIYSLKHFFSAEFPSLKVKRTLPIIIKNIPNFTLQNNLLKTPCTFSTKKSKSILFVNKGELNININLPKNLFYYDEDIPYEINLDLKELNLKVNSLEVSILRTITKINQNLISSNISNKAEITKNEHELNQNLKEYVINHVIKFPKIVKDNSVFSPFIL